MSFSRILLCYDTTREGRRALRFGADLAQQLGAETHLLAVRENNYLTAGYDVMVAQAAEVEEQVAKEILEGITRRKRNRRRRILHNRIAVILRTVRDAAEQRDIL